MLFELDDVLLSRGGRPVLDRFSARIPEGATAIAGPSGSGKTSLLRLLNRLADPDSGRILYRGRPIGELNVLALRREVMLVPQLPALIPGTVEENLRYAARLANREQPDLAGALGAAGLDGGYAERAVARLSVGERQRAMLARALVAEPNVLLLDEPTSALDAAAVGRVEEALRGLRSRRDLSLVIVTHDRDQADRLAERTITLEPAGAGGGRESTAAGASG